MPEEIFVWGGHFSDSLFNLCLRFNDAYMHETIITLLETFGIRTTRYYWIGLTRKVLQWTTGIIQIKQSLLACFRFFTSGFRGPGGPGPPFAPQDFFQNHAVFRQFFGKTLILSKFWAQAPPLGSKLCWTPLTKILDPALFSNKDLYFVFHWVLTQGVFSFFSGFLAGEEMKYSNWMRNAPEIDSEDCIYMNMDFFYRCVFLLNCFGPRKWKHAMIHQSLR